MARPRKVKHDILEDFHEEVLVRQATDASEEPLFDEDVESEVGEHGPRGPFDRLFERQDDEEA
jgi:hypothetical protein